MVCLCLVVGLAANGIYDIPFIKAFIDKWFNKYPKSNIYTGADTNTITPVYESVTTEPIVVHSTTPPIEDVCVTTPEVITTTTSHVD